MTKPSHEDRLLDQLDDHMLEVHPKWKIERSTFEHRMLSPVDPCDRCGRKVFLILGEGQTRPIWVQLGEVKGTDTLFPVCKTKRHRCGDGDSWSVEAALFMESALREWGVTS